MGKLYKGIETLLVLILFLLVCVVSWQVISRYALAEPSTITEELSRFLLMWLGVLGGAYCFRRGEHIAIQLFDPENQLIKSSLSFLLPLLCGLFGVMMTIGGYLLTENAFSLNQTTPTLGISMGFIYLVIPFSGLLIIIETFQRFLAGVSMNEKRGGLNG